MRIQAVNYFPGGLRRREGLNCSICRPTNHASLCKLGEVDQICTLLPPERGGFRCSEPFVTWFWIFLSKRIQFLSKSNIVSEIVSTSKVLSIHSYSQKSLFHGDIRCERLFMILRCLNVHSIIRSLATQQLSLGTTSLHWTKQA